MNKIAKYVKTNRRLAGCTQKQFAFFAGVGLRFLRDLEQGKESLRLDKVMKVLSMFDSELVPVRKPRNIDIGQSK